KITCISLRPSRILPPGEISPSHRGLHRILANPTESQLTDFTQLFSGQPLTAMRSIGGVKMTLP
ncbi:hypothetical protein KXS15_29675, partial [Sinorhizobium meliloti]|uniref:hypothetical protein n=1 Tax=Rhizobium meliloti TaxID=382 RepID=UPI003F13A4D4